MINKILKIRLELLFFIVIFIFYFSRYIYFGDGYLAFFDDDFFYY